MYSAALLVVLCIFATFGQSNAFTPVSSLTLSSFLGRWFVMYAIPHVSNPAHVPNCATVDDTLSKVKSPKGVNTVNVLVSERFSCFIFYGW